MVSGIRRLATWNSLVYFHGAGGWSRTITPVGGRCLPKQFANALVCLIKYLRNPVLGDPSTAVGMTLL